MIDYKNRKSPKYWNDKERCHKEALKYNYRSDFHLKSTSAYLSSVRNNWLDEVCSHMIQIRKKKVNWTLEKCILEANKFQKKSEFSKEVSGAQVAIKRRGWRNVINELFNNKKRKEEFIKCRNDVLNCKNKKEYRTKYLSSYTMAYNRGWLKYIYGYINLRPIITTKHSIERCIEIISTCSSRREFRLKYTKEYDYIRSKGKLYDLVGHLPKK